MVASPTRDSTNGGQLDLYNGRWCFLSNIHLVTLILLSVWNHSGERVPGGRRGGEGASPQSHLVDVVVAGTAVQVSQ